MHEAGQKKVQQEGKNKRNLQKFSNWLPHPFPCKCKGSFPAAAFPAPFPNPLTTTHLIGDPGVLVVIRLFGGYGQHGGVGLLGPLIIQIRVVLIVPGL